MIAGLLVVALVLAASSCREVPETQDLAVAPTLSGDDQDAVQLETAWYAKRVPGSDRYDVYEVRFWLKGEQKPRTFEELLLLERQGLLQEEDEVSSIWILSEEGVSEEEILQRQTRHKPPNPEPAQPHPCDGCDCDPPTTWGCVKCCLGRP